MAGLRDDSGYENRTKSGVEFCKPSGWPHQNRAGHCGATVLTGCIGFVGGDGGYYGGSGWWWDDGGWWGGGGGYDRGHDVHGYSDRGAASRAVAHPSGGGHGSSGGGHAGGGGRR